MLACYQRVYCIIACLLGVLITGCGDDGGTSPTDTAPPATISNLTVQTITQTTATLTWTAPGDDGTSGQAASYDLRYSPVLGAAFQWDQAIQATGEPSPHAAGSQETFIINGLTADTDYTFAVKAADEKQNWSGLSNLAQAHAPAGGVVCAVEPTALIFGQVNLGSTADLSFSITNNGTGTLSGSVSESCSLFSIVSGSGAYALATGQSQTVTVRYAPTEAGNHTCTVETGNGSCSDVSCSGTGTEIPSTVEMVLVPAGAFTMGSDADEGSDVERPEHTPNLSAYSIDTYEVTNAAYALALNWAQSHGLIAIMGDPAPYGTVADPGGTIPYLEMDLGDGMNDCRITHIGGVFGVEAGWEDHPVVFVTWSGAAAYCNWRSGMEGRSLCYSTTTWDCTFTADGYRLPTEAEWEKAARGSADERTFPWGETIDCGRCNYAEAEPCVGLTVAVDHADYSDGLSPCGAWHMGGNVWEWCNDWYDSDYYTSSPVNDPRGPSTGATRVMRGGSWWDGDLWPRCAARIEAWPTDVTDRTGFRAVRKQ
ncbi:MAG: SUMF1/EgtB/PvdO family nonheme iron enzyme [Candidatus Eisenbacteria bacterium]|nr:SUMF1/EgtB/PvdO family nonheme iron enzyme [Candidatus Eisenbacteria bacterium]